MPSVWRVWFSVVVDGYRLHAVVDQPPDVDEFNSIVRRSAAPELTAVGDDVSDDVSVDACLRVVMTDVVSLLDFEYLSRIFTDAYRGLDDSGYQFVVDRLFAKLFRTNNIWILSDSVSNSFVKF